MSTTHTKLKLTRKLGHCTDADSVRYALGGVQIIPQRGGVAYACATNGRVLSLTTVDCEEIAEPQIVPGKLMAPGVVEGNGEWRHRDKRGNAKCLPPIEGRFPKWPELMKPLAPEATLAITVDAKQLLALANDIGYEGKITLLITGAEQQIGVKGAYGVGLLMPFTEDTEAAEAFNAYVAEVHEFVK